MQPSINNDNFGSDNNSRYNNDHELQHVDNRTINERDTTSRKQDNEHENRANDVYNNKRVEDSWDAKSKTYNEDVDDWDQKKTVGTTSANSRNDNNWNNNNHVISALVPDYEDPYDIAAKDDYIDSDHSEYNRGNSRFRWEEPQEEEEE